MPSADRNTPLEQDSDQTDDARVTAVVTSCRRQDLLERTLRSFLAHNTYQNTDIVVVEDGKAKTNRSLEAKFAPESIRWIATNKWVGQIRAIDSAYTLVTAPYIFHMEDDWEFTAGGFIEKSLAILRQYRRCLQVHIRAPDDINDHPLTPDVERAGSVPFRRLVTNLQGEHGLVWHGFSFNPGLRRLSDYQLLGSFAEHTGFCQPGDGTRAESLLGELYYSRGYFAAVLADNNGQGYVRHVGENRHVMEPTASRIRRFVTRLRS
jgi:hypothetical protein